MALSIKTEKADRLARELAGLTGESMTDAVTKALAERLEKERAARSGALSDLLEAFATRTAPNYDPPHLPKDERAAPSGDGA